MLSQVLFINTYIQCPYCKNIGNFQQKVFKGINDYGGLILKCKNCSNKFFVPCRNFYEILKVSGFKIEEIIDFSEEDDLNKILKYRIDLDLMNYLLSKKRGECLNEPYKILQTIPFVLNERASNFAIDFYESARQLLLFYTLRQNLQKLSNLVKVPLVQNLLEIPEEQDFILSKNSWNIIPTYPWNEISDRVCITICPNCKMSLCKEIKNQIKNYLPDINQIYRNYFIFWVKSKVPTPQFILKNLTIQCPHCKENYIALIAIPFIGREEEIKLEHCSLLGIKYYNNSIISPNINNGIYTREESYVILSQLINRWQYISTNIIIVSPFIGYEEKYYSDDNKREKFFNFFSNLISLLKGKKVSIYTRESEWEKIKNLLKSIIKEEVLEKLELFNLLNPVLEEIKSPKQAKFFHAKFYAAIIPKSDKEYTVEILTGSYNLHEPSQTKENLTFLQSNLEEFQKNFLEPLNIQLNIYEPKEYLVLQDFELRKIKYFL